MGNRLKMYVDIMACHSNVTGSGFLCVAKLPNKEQVRFLVDFGLFQGESEENNKKNKEFDRNMKLNSELLFDPSKLSFVLVTHNHVDHIGRLPMLVRNGFTGKIYTSHVTKRFLPVALYDSVNILTEKYKNIHKKPIYLPCDVNETLSKVVGCSFNEKIQINEYIGATFIPNAHIPGSAMILVEITYPDHEQINILFTGDYAVRNDFFDVEKISEDIKNKRISALICESTYGMTSSDNIEYGKFKRLLLEEIEY